ncbi:hypothetical protein [Nonomuraea sp. LPB2021202275-12-8]|uniref:hypothetical protein n=1 Tax=Nonomuraea sp. LPB2021202275-12-8 TaxID=3120159 RepID=UPI00300D9D43
MEPDRVALPAQAMSVDDPIVALVRRARPQGRTWTEIAAALRIGKQAVHEKHGGRSLFRNQE